MINPLTGAISKVSDSIYLIPLIQCLFIYTELDHKFELLQRKFHESVSRKQDEILVDLPLNYWDKCAVLSEMLLNQENKGVI